jgi:oligoribonuclease NrnB/cAMP/cGMP phosphodiesterase (DHH superfamily)
MNILCLHHNDSDGRAAAAIVRRALGSEVWLCEMDYGETPPLERLLVSDHIIVVDFSLPREEMIQLATYHQFTWIDHHKSAIDELADISAGWPGLRDTHEAACVLTWKYFFPGQPIPKAVVYIGDRDIWRWAEAGTGAFNESIYQLDTRPINDELWTALLNDQPEVLDRLITEGAKLRGARLREVRRVIATYGYPALIEGNKTLVINTRSSGDMGQAVRDLGYKIAYCYIDKLQNGQLYTFVTLYSAEVDVSLIAQRFGGGGHAGAAGFHFERGRSPFPAGLDVEPVSA